MKCVKCGTELAGTALVCHACGQLLPRPGDLQLAPITDRPPNTLLSDLEPDDATDMHPPVPGETEVHDFAADRRWLDYGLPLLFLVIGLATYLTILGLRFGPLGLAVLVPDIATALLLELPLAVGIVAVTGIVFNISFGLLSPGVLKLAALNLAHRGLALAVAWLLILGMNWQASLAIVVGGVFLLWFLKTTFELTIYEMIVLWGVNFVFSAMLYAGMRFLFALPHYVF